MGRRLIYTLATMGATVVGAGASAAGLLRHQAGSLRRSFDDDKNRRYSTFTEAIAARVTTTMTTPPPWPSSAIPGCAG